MTPEASRACLGCGAESYLAKWMEFKKEPGKASATPGMEISVLGTTQQFPSKFAFCT